MRSRGVSLQPKELRESGHRLLLLPGLVIRVAQHVARFIRCRNALQPRDSLCPLRKAEVALCNQYGRLAVFCATLLLGRSSGGQNLRGFQILLLLKQFHPPPMAVVLAGKQQRDGETQAVHLNPTSDNSSSQLMSSLKYTVRKPLLCP